MRRASGERSGAIAAASTVYALWVSHIAWMAADRDGHLWYVRAGSDRIEEVAA